MMGVGMHMQMWGSRKARAPIPDLSLSCCVTLSHTATLTFSGILSLFVKQEG